MILASFSSGESPTEDGIMVECMQKGKITWPEWKPNINSEVSLTLLQQLTLSTTDSGSHENDINSF
jgi:hypothetical protein